MEQFPADHFNIDADHWPTMLARISSEDGGQYAAFRRSLNADYRLVWRDIALGYVALGGILALAALAQGMAGGLAAAAIASIAVGYMIAYLQLFIHEAAHWNLAGDRKRSDLIADTTIAWQVGTSVAAYRRVHFEHHRHFGHDNDGERSYALRLSWRLLAEMVTGIHAVRIFLTRSKTAKGGTAARSRLPLARGVAIHSLLLILLLFAGMWPAALAWVSGMAIFFPLFATLRPLLEHRPAASDGAMLSGKRDGITRVFADGFLARTFGGAGFSRHLLHHWEPQVSYTRLADLDRYLAGTSVGPIIAARRTTYGQAFRDILASDRGR